MTTFLTLVQAVGTLLCLLSVTAMIGAGSLMVFDEIRNRRNQKPQKPAAKTRDSIQNHLKKEQLRRDKEKAAHEGFFEESSVSTFDASGAVSHHLVMIPTQKAIDYYKQMNQLAADTAIFDNTEEL